MGYHRCPEGDHNAGRGQHGLPYPPLLRLFVRGLSSFKTSRYDGLLGSQAVLEDIPFELVGCLEVQGAEDTVLPAALVNQIGRHLDEHGSLELLAAELV